MADHSDGGRPPAYGDGEQATGGKERAAERLMELSVRLRRCSFSMLEQGRAFWR